MSVPGKCRVWTVVCQFGKTCRNAAPWSSCRWSKSLALRDGLGLWGLEDCQRWTNSPVPSHHFFFNCCMSMCGPPVNISVSRPSLICLVLVLVRDQCLKLSQKSCRSSCLESQIMNMKLKKNQQKFPGRSSSKVVGLGLVDLWAFPMYCKGLKPDI